MQQCCRRSISWTSLVTTLLLCFIALSTAANSNTYTANAFTPSSSATTCSSLSKKSSRHQRQLVQPPPATVPSVLLKSKTMSSSSSSSTKVMETRGGGASTAAPAPAKRIRISAFDSMRFFLITFICIGHFIRFADPSPLIMNLFSQVNVLVGAFFVLSGYVTAYTATTNGAYEASPKLKPAPAWTLSRIFGYFPLHVIVLALFSPMFLFADVKYNGWIPSIFHGIISVTMTQAWFPLHAEVWNAPSWFLGALAFATATMPYALPPLAAMTKPQLRKVMFYLLTASLLPKIGYSYDHHCWGVMEGIMAPKAFDNLAIFNTQRFNPFFATIEVLMGAAACRLVMLDGVDSEDKDKTSTPTSPLGTLGPLLGMMAVLVLRAMDVLKLNDMLTRTILFLPLFIKFIMACHRVAVAEANGTTKKNQDLVVRFLSSKMLTGLGPLGFPMFLVHGPVGQLFYKKIVATKLFGNTMNKMYGPNFFYVFMATVVGLAAILKALVLDNKAIGEFSKKTAAKWSKDM